MKYVLNRKAIMPFYFMDTLLKELINDERKVNRSLYSSGPYWRYKNKKTVYQIKKYNLKDFRGLFSGVGTSFVDNLIYDVRNEYNFKGRMISSFYKIPIISKIFNEQLKITHNYISNFLKNQSIVFQNSQRVKDLLQKYIFNNTTEFGCVNKFSYKNKEYSCLYLEMADRIDNIKKHTNLNNIKTYLEIGGGFGANVHFLLENFKNIKKIIYLDVVPNIYVGTRYLRNFFKNSIIDYSKTKNMKEIKFSNNDDLEIFCIAPWQIEKINTEIDHFHNAASFVEMPFKVIENYVKHIIRNKIKDISLISYAQYDASTTFDPKKLNDFFNSELKIYEYNSVISELGRKSIYLIKN